MINIINIVLFEFIPDKVFMDKSREVIESSSSQKEGGIEPEIFKK